MRVQITPPPQLLVADRKATAPVFHEPSTPLRERARASEGKPARISTTKLKHFGPWSHHIQLLIEGLVALLVFVYVHERVHVSCRTRSAKGEKILEGVQHDLATL